MSKIGEGYLFEYCEDPDLKEFGYDGCFCIVKKSYWEENHCLDDNSLELEIPGFGETEESCYTYDKEDSYEEAYNKLIEMGFEPAILFGTEQNG